MRRRKIIIIFLCLLSGVIAWRYRPADRGPAYQGRPIADWVVDALHGSGRTPASDVVIAIGTPAVPFIARLGLYGRSHYFNFLSADRLMIFGGHHPRLNRWLRLDDWDVCVERHSQAAWLLYCIGTNAQSAVPDVVNCLKFCPELHYVNTLDLLDTLGEISGTNTAAIPYLIERAHSKDSCNLRAAFEAYSIDGKTNLFAETCIRLAREDPRQFVFAPELYWVRDNRELNEYIVPLLVQSYFDPRMNEEDRNTAFTELCNRTNDAAVAIDKILKVGTNEFRAGK